MDRSRNEVKSMHVSHEEFHATRMFGALDGLRAMSVIAVIWHHTSGRPGPEFFSKGYFGVDFFFAISGFLITTLLLRERRKTGRISIRRFYVRRFFRIFPIYYIVLAIYVILVLATRQGTSAGDGFLANLPAFLSYTSNWFVDLSHGDAVTFYFAWSLATEEQFYLFWPPLLAVLLLVRKQVLWLPLAAIGLLVVVNQTALFVDGNALPTIILASLALPILLGAAAAVVLDNPRTFRLVSPVVAARWFGPLAVVIMLASLVIETPAQLTQVLMVLIVMAVCITERTMFHGLLMFRPLAYVGVISYGIYLMHMLCANAVRIVVGSNYGIAVFASTAALAVVVAAISFHFIESPILRFGRRFGSNSHTDAAARLKSLVDSNPSTAESGASATAQALREPDPDPAIDE